MRSPTVALLWQIWRRNSQAAWMLVGITLVAWIADVSQYGFHPVRSGGGPGPLNEMAAMASFLLLLAVFSYTEPTGDKGIGRFPHRLFTLPVSTLRLVAVPMLTGVVAMVLLYLAWMGRFTTDAGTSRALVAVLMATFMVFYQTVLWTSARMGALRLVLLGAIAIVFFGVGMIPSYAGADPPQWKSPAFLGTAVASAALASFLFAWNHVARLRSGGERGSGRLDAIRTWAVDLLPSRRGVFASPSSAQFWYEWRSAGMVLPVVVAGLLFIFVAPLSWAFRDDAGSGMGFLLAALMMPIVLAVPIGLAFAKPVFWSEELAIPPFIAVRPLSGAQIVAIKLRVAALAAAVSWLIVLTFLTAWLALWGDASWLSSFAIQLWAVNDHSVVTVLGIAALVVVAGVLLTWRFLIASVWSGLSGNRRAYVWSVISVVLVPVAYLLFTLDRLPGWVLEDPARMTPFVWSAAVLVIAKYWLAARTWRRATPSLASWYFVTWLAATAALVALATVFWRVVRVYVAMDTLRTQGLLILLALLAIPLARIGLAPALLERNRHRS